MKIQFKKEPKIQPTRQPPQLLTVINHIIATLGMCIACEFHQLWAARPCIYHIFRHLTKWLIFCRTGHACTVIPLLFWAGIGAAMIHITSGPQQRMMIFGHGAWYPIGCLASLCRGSMIVLLSFYHKPLEIYYKPPLPSPQSLNIMIYPMDASPCFLIWLLIFGLQRGSWAVIGEREWYAHPPILYLPQIGSLSLEIPWSAPMTAGYQKQKCNNQFITRLQKNKTKTTQTQIEHVISIVCAWLMARLTLRKGKPLLLFYFILLIQKADMPTKKHMRQLTT